MQITGKNLELVSTALSRAISDVHTHIGSCPDVYCYADDITELEKEQRRLERFKERVDAAIEREKR